MTRLKSILAVPIVLLALVGCSALSVVNAVAPDDGVQVESNIAYGVEPRQKLDIYRPLASNGRLPTVLFFYGGSWKRGDRADYAFVGQSLARQGFLVAVADYRTYPDVRFPDFVGDGAQAVKWLSKNAIRFGGSTSNIHMIGHSAGAHIAALIALDARYLEGIGGSRDILGSWVGLAGPYAFYPSQTRSVRDVFSSVNNEDEARPITRVDGGAPPALLLHGGNDTTVYPVNSIDLARKLRSVGVNAVAHIYDGVGHAPLVLSLSAPFTRIAPSLEDITAYLRHNRPPRSVQAVVH